jgi:hypothetical protein
MSKTSSGIQNEVASSAGSRIVSDFEFRKKGG